MRTEPSVQSSLFFGARRLRELFCRRAQRAFGVNAVFLRRGGEFKQEFADDAFARAGAGDCGAHLRGEFAA